MKKLAALVPMLGLLLVFATTTHAQTLTTGQWTGTVTPPNGNAVEVFYDVAYEDEALVISMTVPEMGDQVFTFSDIVLDEELLFFTWQPGTDLDCQLTPHDDGHYEGECVDEEGAPGTLVMIPPSEE